ncbi:MAG: hypothetical protein U9Q20_07890 [Campylobacterota bacterium]|nr:hypothetical protein [Campylobacterota bacterium]
MTQLPNDSTKINIDGATTDFYTYIENNITKYYFDTSDGSGHPMVNAMAGLQALPNDAELIMINHHAPSGLFPKIEANYDYTVEELIDGTSKMVFTYKKDTIQQTDFKDNKCGGGC